MKIIREIYLKKNNKTVLKVQLILVEFLIKEINKSISLQDFANLDLSWCRWISRTDISQLLFRFSIDYHKGANFYDQRLLFGTGSINICVLLALGML